MEYHIEWDDQDPTGRYVSYKNIAVNQPPGTSMRYSHHFDLEMNLLRSVEAVDTKNVWSQFATKFVI